jgi:predicted O-linked N-acetylglucosamine transferase (SPINDLY family)
MLKTALSLHQKGRLVEAASLYRQILSQNPQNADALHLLGVIKAQTNNPADALELIDHAIKLRPNNAWFFTNRGIALAKLKRFDEALVSFDRALIIKPDLVAAHNNRGFAQQELKRFDEALVSYDRALAIDPNDVRFLGARLFCTINMSRWGGLEDDVRVLAEVIASARYASEPFAVLATSLPANLLKMCAEIYIREKYPQNILLPTIEGQYQHGRIRLGYFSSDFSNHAVAYLMAELFEIHDRALFEIIAFAFGPVKKDAMRLRLEKSFDRFFDVGAMSDKDVAQLARSLEVDIAIDLNGLTQGARTGVLAMRAAPIQVNYLGYPGTMGANYIDYLIADPILIREDQQQHYVEKIVYLPNSYQANDSKRRIGDKHFTRVGCGLPQEGFVFCCFNNNYKISPVLFDIWMNLLRAVEGSVLWLLEDNAFAAKNLRTEAKIRAVDPRRLVFAPRMEPSDHLARHELADLFLDTLPYNAHTTASDALWAGLPLVTCSGQMFAGRVAASLLHAAGLQELITHDLNAYEALALELATNPQRLFSLRQRMLENRLTCPLFDTRLFTKHMETAYITMWKQHRAGLAPEHIYVAP